MESETFVRKDSFVLISQQEADVADADSLIQLKRALTNSCRKGPSVGTNPLNAGSCSERGAGGRKFWTGPLHAFPQQPLCHCDRLLN